MSICVMDMGTLQIELFYFIYLFFFYFLFIYLFIYFNELFLICLVGFSTFVRSLDCECFKILLVDHSDGKSAANQIVFLLCSTHSLLMYKIWKTAVGVT
jgi:hypothetical protein